MKFQKIISGGQTGVDRAALDACLQTDFPCGGWCPANRLAEDGKIPKYYPLQEILSDNYDDRTEKNIQESDATMIIYKDEMSGGTLLTHNYAKKTGKPLFLCKGSPFFIDESIGQLMHFLKINRIKTLNIAGPRASQWNEAYQTTYEICSKLIKEIRWEEK